MSTRARNRGAPERQAPSISCILLIESNDETATLVANAIRGARELSLERETTLAGALERLRSIDPRLVLVATELPDSRGTATIAALRAARPEPPVLVFGDISEPEAVRFAAAGAQACLQRKALTQATLQRAISRALASNAAAASRPTSAQAASALATSPTVGAMLIRNDGTIRACNPALVHMLGYQVTNEIVDRNITSLMLQADDWIAWQTTKTPVEPITVTLKHRRGSQVHCKGDVHPRHGHDGSVVGYEVLLVDCTAQRQLEHALESASRAEALAALTAGVAHDFNNLLTVIVGNLYLLAEIVRDNEALLGKVKVARDAARRGANLTKQLLSFARNKTGEPQVTRLADVIENIKLLLERALGSSVKLSTSIAADAWPISIDVTQLESAIINLAVNARDALENGGTVTLGVENAQLDQHAAKRLALAAGDYVCVSVSDNGPGIPESIRERIFEPFFTTKGTRGGTGLGLSMVRRMVTGARGAVELLSTPGRGTTFKLLLPRARGEVRNNEMTQPLSTLPSGSEAVLVACRDAQVTQTVHELLHVLGYAVNVTAPDSALREQLARAEADLLVCDAPGGPQASQGEIALTARAAKPRLKILLVADDAWNADPTEEGVDGILRKPFSLADLAQSVRAALDR